MIPRTKRGGWPYSRAPNVDFEINWDNPVTKGLIFSQPLFGPSVQGTQRYVDLVRKRIMAPVNTPAWTSDGVYGQSLLFDDGGPDYLHLKPNVVSAFPITMACWFYSDDLTINQALVAMSSEDDNTFNGMWLFLRGGVAGDFVSARIYDGVTLNEAVTTLAYSANTWQHACAVFAGTQDRRAYLNGGNKGVDVVDLTALPDMDNTTIGSIFYWTGAANEVATPFSGMLAEVHIWARALSDSEIAWLANPNNRWKLWRPRLPRLNGFVAVAPPVGAIINQIQFGNVGADLFNGTLI